MPYTELIKNFNRIRDYMRDFYVYGFKTRDEYTQKSARSYDDEKRRMESLLGDYMQFKQTQEGKNYFISIDSRVLHHNPLYKAWKAKSFTDKDITLHFIVFDILHSPEVSLTLEEITEKIDGYIETYEKAHTFDQSTLRKKLNEYAEEGIIIAEKSGRTMRYRRAKTVENCDADALDFFSEVAPCGVVGSFLLDKQGNHEEYLSFKHHYITAAMDSEILCELLEAISQKKNATIEITNREKNETQELCVVPLQIYVSVQNGRQYLVAYEREAEIINSYRIDYIFAVNAGECAGDFEELREKFNVVRQHIWGANTTNALGNQLEHVEFTIKYDDDEKFILKRLMREKRCGKVIEIDNNTCRFVADVYDANEMVPWIRTFICRITEISISNEEVENRFKNDLMEMYALYESENQNDSEYGGDKK